jgi:hypothetical protein
MKRTIKLAILTLLFLQIGTQISYAQFGLKKLKNNLVKSVKADLNKKKDSLQNVTIDKALKKITNLCLGDKKIKNLTKINAKSLAFADYQNLKNEINQFKKDLKSKEILNLVDNSQKIITSIKAIKAKEPNADLSSECNRITNLKTKYKK